MPLCHHKWIGSGVDMYGEPLGGQTVLPVWPIVKRSYGFVWQHRRLLALPLVIVFLLHAAATAGSLALQSLLGKWSAIPNLIWTTCVLICLMSFVVGLHRTVLLDEDRPGTAFLHWDEALWSYFKAWLKLTLASAGIAFVLTLAGILTMTFTVGQAGLLQSFSNHQVSLFVALAAGLLLVVILTTRLSLAFPAAALGETRVFKLSWGLTGNAWPRLVAVFLLVSLPFLAGSLLFSLPLLAGTLAVKLNGGSLLDQLNALFLASFVLSAFLKAVSTAVLTVTLSLSYAHLAPRYRDAFAQG